MARKKKLTKMLIGYISVDAGICWIGDPCYILHKGKESEPLPKAIGKDWYEFVGKCYNSGQFTECVNSEATIFKFDLGHDGLGVCVQTGGDGCYPVYGHYELTNDGTIIRLAKITVEFK